MKTEIFVLSIFLLCLVMHDKAMSYGASDSNSLVVVEPALKTLQTELQHLGKRLDAVNYRLTIDSWFSVLLTSDLQCRMDNLTAELGLEDDMDGLRARLNNSTLIDASDPAIKQLEQRLDALEAKTLPSALDEHLKLLNEHIDSQTQLLTACHSADWPGEMDRELDEISARLDELQLAGNASDVEKRLHALTERFDALLRQQDELATQSALQVLTKQLDQLRKTIDGLPPQASDVPSVGDNSMPSDCRQALGAKGLSGTHTIHVPAYKSKMFIVLCEAKYGGGWLVVQRRESAKVDFNRNWSKYQQGFGNFNSSFFLGLDKLHVLTGAKVQQELLIVLTDFKGVTKTAHYTDFAVGNARSGYALQRLGEFEGSNGLPDSLRAHVSMKFSTFDRDNDQDGRNCAKELEGGWWYKNCGNSALNGKLRAPRKGNGITWRGFHGGQKIENLKFVQMMIRPRVN